MRSSSHVYEAINVEHKQASRQAIWIPWLIQFYVSRSVKWDMRVFCILIFIIWTFFRWCLTCLHVQQQHTRECRVLLNKYLILNLFLKFNIPQWCILDYWLLIFSIQSNQFKMMRKQVCEDGCEINQMRRVFNEDFPFIE